MKLMLISIFIFCSLLFIVGSEAIPTCTFRSGSCSAGEVCVFSIVQDTNSHVGSCGTYNTQVCCTEITSATVRTGSCNAGEGALISLFQTSNAHAGRGSYYNNIVCAKTTDNPIVTNVRTSCNSKENCVVSMFQSDNTHVGNCNYYSNKLCIQELFNTTITIILNNTTPNLNESIGVQGIATRADGTAIDTSSDPEDVKIFVNSTSMCTTDTNSTGGYTCNFTAPNGIGLYELNVTIGDPITNKNPSNTTTFSVRQVFGQVKQAEKTSSIIACYEEPRVIQNPDGTIRIARVRICAFK